LENKWKWDDLDKSKKIIEVTNSFFKDWKTVGEVQIELQGYICYNPKCKRVYKRYRKLCRKCNAALIPNRSSTISTIFNTLKTSGLLEKCKAEKYKARRRWRLKIESFFDYADKNLRKNKMEEFSEFEKEVVEFYFNIPQIRKLNISKDVKEKVITRLMELVTAVNYFRFGMFDADVAYLSSFISTGDIDNFLSIPRGMRNELKDRLRDLKIHGISESERIDLFEKVEDEVFWIQGTIAKYILDGSPKFFEKVRALVKLPYQKWVKVPTLIDNKIQWV